MSRKLGGHTAGTAADSDHSIPYDVVFSNKCSRKGRGRRDILMAVSCKASVVCSEAQLSRKWMNTCQLMGSSEEILFVLFFSLFMCSFGFPYYNCYLDLQVFSFLSCFLPVLQERNVGEQHCGSLAGVNPTQS